MSGRPGTGKLHSVGRGKKECSVYSYCTCPTTPTPIFHELQLFTNQKRLSFLFGDLGFVSHPRFGLAVALTSLPVEHSQQPILLLQVRGRVWSLDPRRGGAGQPGVEHHGPRGQ